MHLSKGAIIPLMLLGLLNSALPATGSGWGSVDARLILVFHPTMATFDYFQGRFLRGPTDKLQKPNSPKNIAEAWTKAQPKLKSLNQERAELLRARQALIADREATLTEIAEDDPISSGVERDRKKQLEGFDRQFTEKSKELEGRFAYVEKTLEETREEMDSPLYLSKSETQARIAELKTEISQLISETAHEREMDVIIDQSLGKNYCPPQKEFVPPSENRPIPFTGAESSFRAFEQWDPVTVIATATGPDGKAISAEKHIALARAQSLFTNLRNYLNFLPYMQFDGNSLSFGSSIFMIGGEDITLAVAQKIFKKYKVSPNLQKRFTDLIQSSLDQDAGIGM